MGDVKNRGSRERPLWYCRYRDIDGKRKHRPTHQPTKAFAIRFVAEVEARKQRFYKGANPTSGLRKTPPTGLMDYLSGDEVARLLEYARQHAPDVFPMLATAVYTGMRKGELFGLRWIDVLFDRGIIHVAHSYGKTPKSDKWRPVPLHPALRPILREWQRRCTTGPLVFPVILGRSQRSRMGTPDDMMGIEELRREAGCHVPVRPWHRMRHTFASHYVMAGGNLLALQKILGHSKFEMTQIYSHLAPDYMAGEIARLSFAIRL